MSEWLSLPEVAVRPGLASRPVAVVAGGPVGRAQFLADVDAWQAAFSRHGGRRYALFFESGYEFAAALFGAWHAGKEVFLPGDAQPATLAKLLPQVDGTAGALPGAIAPVPGLAMPREPLSLATTRLVVYTSGSGGEPAAMPKHLGQLDAEVQTLETTFGGRFASHPGAPIHATVSHQHIYGLLFCTLWPLAAGRPFIAERILYPEEMAACLGPAPAVLVSSPAHLKRLPETLDWQGARAGLLAVFSSGGPLPPESAQAALEAMGHSPTEVFGSSETGGIAWRERAAHGDHWQTLPGVEWRIEEGLLAVRSAHLPDAAEWWQTSDRARGLEDGGFVLQGRADRVVKIGEKRVSLTAVESALRVLPAISEARAFVQAGEAGERLAVAAVPSAAGRVQLEAGGKRAFNEHLRQALLDVVERVALPRRFRYVEAFPVNPQGKTTEAMLAALFRETMPDAEWEHRADGEARAALGVTADLAVFDGHFEGMPVLPGVAQLDWAIEFARECFALPPRFLRAETLKFHRPIRPPARLVLNLRWSAELARLEFTFTSAAGTHSSGRVVFGDAA